MSFQKENYEIYNLCLTLIGLSFVVLLIEWSIYIDILHVASERGENLLQSFYMKIHPKSMLVRLFYVFAVFALFFVKPPIKRGKPQNVPATLIASIFIVALFLFGFSNLESYNVFVYPTLLFLVAYAAHLVFSLFSKSFQNENIFGLSNEKALKQLSYVFQTDQGPLTISSAEQHIYVQGGSGAGKSDSILKPTIYQHVFTGNPALIYDFKGNPVTLGKTVHTAFVHAKLEGIELKSKLKFFNFADVTRSHRINMFSPNYLKDNADIQQTIATFLKNYSKEFREGKGDVWYKGAKAIWVALITRFQNDDELRGKLSLPIINQLLLTNDKEALIAFICDDEKAMEQLSSVADAKDGNMKQFTGYITSANDMCSMLANKNTYWLLSEDEINLNINTKEDPIFLCIASDEAKDEVYNPLVATIIDIASRYFLQQNKLPTLFQLDEIYTLFLPNLAKQANVFRSNGVCLQIGNQLRSQLVDMYGEAKAKIVMGACGNTFFGQSSDSESSESLQKILSEVEVSTLSVSTSDSGQSFSDGTKRQKAVEIRDIAAQSTGMFSGKIANGKPPYFKSLQFERFKYHDQEIDVPAFVLEHTTLEKLEADIENNYQSIRNLASQIINNYKKPEN